MKVFVIGCFVVLGLIGTAMFMSMQVQSHDYGQVQEYLDSRGKAKIPSSWRAEMGKGI